VERASFDARGTLNVRRITPSAAASGCQCRARVVDRRRRRHGRGLLESQGDRAAGVVRGGGGAAPPVAAAAARAPPAVPVVMGRDTVDDVAGRGPRLEWPRRRMAGVVGGGRAAGRTRGHRAAAGQGRCRPQRRHEPPAQAVGSVIGAGGRGGSCTCVGGLNRAATRAPHSLFAAHLHKLLAGLQRK